MRIGRVLLDGLPTYVRIEGDRAVVQKGDLGSLTDGTATAPIAGLRWLAPVIPSKVIGVATNYADHAKEMNKPVPAAPRLFLKAPSSIVSPGEPILIPPGTSRVDPEGELAVVIGKHAFCVPRQDALDYVLGYTCANDVTARDFQKEDVIFGRAKSFDSFCPLGPWIETELDPSDVALSTSVNGEVRASGRTSQMIFGVADLVAFISSIMTLLPGDVISTGTPPGVAPIKAGDRVSVWVEGIGTLENPVVDRRDR